MEDRIYHSKETGLFYIRGEIPIKGYPSEEEAMDALEDLNSKIETSKPPTVYSNRRVPPEEARKRFDDIIRHLKKLHGEE